MSRLLLICGALFVSITSVLAADFLGTVRSVAEGYATVASDSAAMPRPGDKAQIFFKLGGAEDEVSVADGVVYEITATIEVELISRRAAIRRRLKIYPSNRAGSSYAPAYLNRADAYEELGKKQLARADLSRAKELQATGH